MGGDDIIGDASINIASLLPFGEEHIHIFSLKGGQAGENIGTILSHVASSALKAASPMGGNKKKTESEEATGIPVRNHGSLAVGIAVFTETPFPRPPEMVSN